MIEGSSGRVTVLGLDLSYARTGLCLWDGDQITASRFTSVGDNFVVRAQSVRSYIRDYVGQQGAPTLFAVEQPVTRAFSVGPLTGLWFIVMEYLLETGIPVVSVSNSATRKIVEVGSLRGMTGTQRKHVLLNKALAMLGPKAPLKFVHDEADAFFVAYVAHRFWSKWKCGVDINMSALEHDIWFSSESVVKVPKRPRKIKKRPSTNKKLKGIIYREGEFLFLPASKETRSG